MAVFTRATKNLIIKIDEFIDNVEIGLLVFKEGIKSYLNKDAESFSNHLHKLETLESNADRLQRSIENEMITYSILPQQRSEVSTFIDELDEIIDTLKSSLNEINIELPVIPSNLVKNFMDLTETSVESAEALIPAARTYFRAPVKVREKLLKVYYFESETDKAAVRTKKIIFQEMNELDLAHKTHLRDIIHHIEKISDLAQKAADLLSAMAIKTVL